MKLGTEVGLGPGHIVLDGIQLLSTKRDTAALASNFRPISVVAKRLDGSRCHSLGRDVGLGPGDIALDGDPAPPKGTVPPQFLACVCCGQTEGWIKMPLGRAVDLGDTLLDGDPAPPPRKGHNSPPSFRPTSIVAKRSPISANAEHLLKTTTEERAFPIKEQLQRAGVTGVKGATSVSSNRAGSLPSQVLFKLLTFCTHTCTQPWKRRCWVARTIMPWSSFFHFHSSNKRLRELHVVLLWRAHRARRGCDLSYSAFYGKPFSRLIHIAISCRYL